MEGETAALARRAHSAAKLCGLLANENRLMILCQLSQGPMNVAQLHRLIGGISQPALSQHLALLKAHGLVTCRKAGQSVIYWMSGGKVQRLMKVLCELYGCENPPRDREKQQIEPDGEMSS